MNTQNGQSGELHRGDSVDIYLRISRDPDNDKLGVARQERECRELCKRRGWKVAEVHTDDDLSAFSGKTRPGYEELLQRLQVGKARGVISWHPDRLHRSTKELDRFIDIVNACGAGVATVQGGVYDLTTASGRGTARMLGVMARMESEHKSERILSKMRQLQRDGKFTGAGRRPYGYEYVKTAEGKLESMIRRDDEAAIVRELARRYMGGESLLSLVRDLNVRKVPAATGGPWGLASVSRLLRSLRITGLREVEGKLKPAPWPAIITEREHRQLLTLLARNHKSGARAQRSYLLTGGLLVCGGCGNKMIGRPINGKPTYGCDKSRGGCGKVWSKAELVDGVVFEAVVQVVDGKGLAKKLQRGSMGADPALDEIERQETRLREVEEDYGTGELDRAAYRKISAHAKARLEELRKTYRPEPVTLDYGKDNPLALAWPALSLGGRRAVLDAVIKRARIMPVGHRAAQTFKAKDRFDTERVRIDWKV